MLFMYAVAAFSRAIILLLPCSVETIELSTGSREPVCTHQMKQLGAVVNSTYDKVLQPKWIFHEYDIHRPPVHW